MTSDIYGWSQSFPQAHSNINNVASKAIKKYFLKKVVFNPVSPVVQNDYKILYHIYEKMSICNFSEKKIKKSKKNEKTFKKGIDKGKKVWYNSRAVPRGGATVIEN